MIKKKIFFLIILLVLTPTIFALTISDTTISSSASNYTIWVDTMTMDQLIVRNTSIEFYNFSSVGSNFTNINQTYEAVINFYNLTVGLAVYNVNTSVYLFNSTATNQTWNVTFAVNQTIRIDRITVLGLIVNSPTNTTYDTSDVDLIVTTTGNVNTHWYSLDGGANITFTPNISISNIGWEANHTLSIWVNDSSNNIVNEIVRFYIGEYKNKWFWFYLVSLGLAIGLFILGYSQESYIITLLSGFLFMSFAITFIYQGYPTLNNTLMRLSITLLTSAIGLYITASSALGLIREGL